MTKQETLELFAQHHPDIGEKEALRIINKAMSAFSEETKISQESFYETTASNQRYYDLPEGIIEINRRDCCCDSTSNPNLLVISFSSASNRSLSNSTILSQSLQMIWLWFGCSA